MTSANSQLFSLSDYYYDTSSSLRLIDTEAAAISSSTHLLWSMGGKEREALGSKCIAGLQVMSCARAQISNDANSDRNSNSDSSSSSGGRGGDGGGSIYDSNNSDSNRRKSDGSGNNKMSGTVNSNSIREQGSRSSSSSSSVGSKEEHILIFKRPLEKSDDDAGEKFTTGDRVIISLEMDNRPFRACKNPPIKEQSVSNQSTHSADIEDLGSKNKNSRICSGPSSSSSSSSSASTDSDDSLAPYLVEPHIITGQIIKISLTAIHISVRERPRRFLR